MKPVTQQWTFNEDSGTVDDEKSVPVEFFDSDNGVLAAAAPDMARALAIAEELVSAIQQGHRVDDEALERAHAAINGARRKAGVL